MNPDSQTSVSVLRTRISLKLNYAVTCLLLTDLKIRCPSGRPTRTF